MSKPYSQWKALWAITRASFKGIFAQPVSVVFSLLFPIIFILIFGAFGKGGGQSYKIGFDPGTDTTSIFYQSLRQNPVLKLMGYADTAKMNDDLNKGNLTGVLQILPAKDSTGKELTRVKVRSTTASMPTLGAMMHELDYNKMKFEQIVSGNKNQLVEIEQPTITEGRKYRQIDFVLPGQVGFSILFATLFGVAFTFFTLREQLVLKRFYASPVKRVNIIIGIGVSRLFFQLLNVVVLVLFGHFFLHFTLQNGWTTFFEMILLSVVMLFLLMGVGFIFGSIVKTDAPLPLLINLFGFPQMLLSGTFFPITVFPPWLQDICYFLPLTQFNNAMRKIAFDGLHIWNCGEELGILAIWIAIIYAIMVKLLRWN